MHIDFFSPSDEQFRKKYAEFYKKYSDKKYHNKGADGVSEIEKELIVLKSKMCMQKSDRVNIPLVCTVITGFFAAVVGAKMITPKEENVKIIFDILLIIFGILFLIWMHRLFSYEREYLWMKVYIIEKILQEKNNEPEEEKQVLPEGTFEYHIQITPID